MKESAPTPVLDLAEQPPAEGVYHGTTSVEEWEAMPESFAQEAGAEEPFDASAGPVLETEARKEETSAFHSFESLPVKDKIKVRALGDLAIGTSTVWQGARQRFNKLAVELHSRFYGSNDAEQPQVAEEAQAAPETPTQAPETKQYVTAAAEAKAAGDWTAYQRELLKFADAADQSEEDGTLSAGALDSRVRRADKKVDGIDAGDVEQADVKDFYNRQEWLDPRNVLDLKNTIREEVGKNPDNKQEIISKLLEEYYGAYTSDLDKGEVVPMQIQEQVTDMLNLSKNELNAMAEQANTVSIRKLEPKKPEDTNSNVVPIDNRRRAAARETTLYERMLRQEEENRAA